MAPWPQSYGSMVEFRSETHPLALGDHACAPWARRRVRGGFPSRERRLHSPAMGESNQRILSVVVPVFNEAEAEPEAVSEGNGYAWRLSAALLLIVLSVWLLYRFATTKRPHPMLVGSITLITIFIAKDWVVPPSSSRIMNAAERAIRGTGLDLVSGVAEVLSVPVMD